MKKVELILPAGDLEKTKVAFLYGADAVYGGLAKYSLRKAEVNFNLKSLKKAINLAHNSGKKFYVTLNIFPKNKTIKEVGKEIKQIAKFLPDAFVISDPGIINLVKKIAPKIPIHLSTQANTLNYQAAKFWYSQGIKRAVLARELTLKEITEIHQKVPKLELEIFVHGAMCISYSGRCLLSAALTGKEANQGECTQPCRWKYKIKSSKQVTDNKFFLEEEKRPGEYFSVFEDDKGTYIMNSKDLCLIEYLPEIVKAGVNGLKIEGRNKSIYYVAITAKTYKKGLGIALDSSLSLKEKKQRLKKLKKELETLNFRGYTTGFLLDKARKGEVFAYRAPIKNYNFVGVVRSKNSKGIVVEVRNQIKRKDELEFVTPNGIKKIHPYTKNFCEGVKIQKILNHFGKEIEVTNPGPKRVIVILPNLDFPIFTIIRKRL